MDAGSNKPSLDSDITQTLQKMQCLCQRYIKKNEDCLRLKEETRVLKLDLQNAHEIEKSQCNSIESSRKLITMQQSIIAQLVNLKDEIKIYQEKSKLKDKQINELENEITSLKKLFDAERDGLLRDYHEELAKRQSDFEKELQILKSELDVFKCKSECDIRLLNNQIHSIHEEHKEQTSLLAVEYEDRLQRANALILQKTNEIKTNNDKYNANISLYKRKIEEMERIQLHANRTSLDFKTQSKISNDTDTSNDIYPKQTYSKPRDTFKVTPTFQKAPTPKLHIQFTDYKISNPTNESDPPKQLVKPMKRKLFNKETEFTDLC